MLKLNNCIRALVVLTIVAACWVMAVAQSSQKSAHQAQDEAAIRENVRKMEEGWNTKNGTIFSEPYAEDADGVAIGGFVVKGHDVIEKVHWELMVEVYPESVSRNDGSIRDVEWIITGSVKS
jgi:hypothetical protein